MLLGGRYDRTDSKSIDITNSTVSEKDVDAFTGRIGVTFDLSEQISVYTLYAQSFDPVLSDVGQDGSILDPQEGEIYELGLKTEWFDGMLGVNAAVFRLDRENIPISAEVGPGERPFSVSSGLQRSDGVELEINGQPPPGWNLSFAGSLLDSRFIERNDPFFGFTPGGTADWQIGLHTSYELQSGPLKGLGLGASVFAIDERGVGTFVPGTIPGYERFDLHAFYRGFEDVDLALLVRNVTDETYIEGADRANGYAQFGSPRAVLFTVRYAFGGR